MKGWHVATLCCINEMENILYISYDGLTDTLGQSQILPYLVGLSKRGYSFTVLSAEKKHNYAKQSSIVQAICDEHNIRWEYISYTKNPPIVSSLYDIWRMKKRAFDLHKRYQFFAVHSRSYMASIVASTLKQKVGLKLIFDMRGFYPDEKVEGGSWNLNLWYYSKVYHFFKRKEKSFLLNSDAVVSLTHAGKNIIQNEWGFNQKNIDVIPCATDVDFFKPLTIPNDKKGLNIGYLGSLGTWYMLPEMVSFFKVLLGKYPNAHFTFLTPDDPELIWSEIQKHNILKSKITIKFCNRAELPEALSKIDIGLFFINPSFSKQASSPVKQGELMSMGIPIITNSGVGDTDQIVAKYLSGVLIDSFEESEYQKAVGRIDEMLSWNKTEIRQGAVDYFSLEKGIDNYEKIYLNL